MQAKQLSYTEFKEGYREILSKLRDQYDNVDLSHTAKIITALVSSTIAWAILYNRMPMPAGMLLKPPPLSFRALLPSLLATLSKSVDLVGVLNLYQEMRHNLGVKLTVPKLYQVFSIVGYVFQTIGQLTITHTGVGRVFWAFNFLFLCIYTYMGYLTMAYNGRLEYPEEYFDNFHSTTNTVNLPALVAWVTLNLAASYVWINEGSKSIANTTYKNELLAAIGFLIASIGQIRAGYVASVTSSSEIKPFVGAMTIAAANLMAGMSLIPLAYNSPVARVYIAGYASVLYSNLINSYYAFKEERAANATKKRAKL